MKLPQNVGTIDRIARLVLGIALGGVVLGGVVAAPLAFLVGALAVIMLATAASGFCPIYALLRIRTCPVQRV